ncbi:uncharacterized protein SCHCODRAFT_02640500 [Schizophyllum commune H4-8]|nr:uncharacterized protein SCHCODRAFT_02640500 [Schizophyllum commune H4-8]KAI5887011.1 hypothetical protein SCHCODRAFT_02640500 [Schizophyllum commune H4-8]
MALLTFEQTQEAGVIDRACGTPTTDTMSLFTPLQMDLKALPRLETDTPRDGQLPPSLSIAPDATGVDVVRSPMLGEPQCPGAPLITDMDSFGDGSEEGDFADLVSLAASKMSESDRAVTQSNVHLIPHHDVVRRIQEWQSEVEPEDIVVEPQERAGGPWPAKRPRSVDSGDEEVPRTRPRIPKAAPRSVVQFCAPPGEEGVEDECQAEAPD